VIGCATNKSIYFDLQKPRIIEQDNIFFTVDWRDGIPLYYFGYKGHLINLEMSPRKQTRFFIKAETNNEIEFIKINSFTVKIEEINVFLEKKHLEEELTLWIKAEENYPYKYTGSFEIEDILPPDIKTENDLIIFKKIKYIYLEIEVEYKMNTEIKHKKMKWKFKPHIYKSNAIWDELMSV
jgi:hypothetical protein